MQPPALLLAAGEQARHPEPRSSCGVRLSRKAGKLRGYDVGGDKCATCLACFLSVFAVIGYPHLARIVVTL